MSKPSLAPQPATRSARGLGLLAAVLGALAAGIADALVAAHRAPLGTLSYRGLPWLVAHSVALLTVAGLPLGLAQELLLASWLRSEPLRSLARYLTDGPRRWFAPDPLAARRVTLLSVGLAITLGPIFPGSYAVISAFHSQFLAALACALLLAGSLALALVVTSALSAPLTWLFARLRPVARPGLVALVALALLTLQTVRLARLQRALLRELDGGAVALFLAFVLTELLVLLLAGAFVRGRRRGLGALALGLVAGTPLALLLVSALTLGSRQTVLTTLLQHSELTGSWARRLQRATDRDHDGYSPLFGGGDCDDHNPHINPGADDKLDDALDQNCSGSAAHVDREESDGRLTAVPATLPMLAPSVMLFTVDALRLDALGAYGRTPSQTPTIDALAHEGAVFAHAYCASPRSVRGLAALWTGRYPSLLAWGNEPQFPSLDEGNVTFTETLMQGGYRTGAFSASNSFASTQGFYQGFELHREGEGFRSEGEPTINQLRAWLQVRELEPRPFFGWTHLMDPHEPVESYPAAVARVDTLLAGVVAELRAMARRRPVYVIVMGTQGEAMVEHGVSHHDFDLHEEAVHVPLIVWGLGIPAGPRDALTSAVDLAPTVLNLARLAVTSPVSGRSLVPVLFAPGPGVVVGPQWRDHLYAEVMPDGVFRSESELLVAWPSALLHVVREQRWELFDVARDPGERRNVYDREPALAAALRVRLLGFSENASLASNRAAARALLRLPER